MIPLNLYPRHTVLGRTKRGDEVFIDDKWRDLLYQIIRRLGGEAALSVSDIETLGNSGSQDSLISEVSKEATEAAMLALAMGDAPSTPSSDLESEDVRDAGFWCPFVNADDTTAVELIFHDDGSPIMVWNPT